MDRQCKLLDEIERLYREHGSRSTGSFIIIYYIIYKYIEITGKNPKVDEIRDMAIDLISRIDFDVALEKFSYTEEYREYLEKEFCNPLYRPIEISNDNIVKIYEGFHFIENFKDGWSNIPNVVEFLYPNISHYVLHRIKEIGDENGSSNR